MTLKTFISKIILGKTKTELYDNISKQIIFDRELSSKLYDELDKGDNEFFVGKFKIKQLKQLNKNE